MSAVFGSLNQGGDITRALKKVDQSEMTHKNPALRGSAPVNIVEKTPSVPKKAEGIRKGLPKKALEGNKWTVVRNVWYSAYLAKS